jgi:DNA-binding Lrp family transcriptional regulator
MPRISQEKIKKIKEAIIALLFSRFPYAMSTAAIARELARDEEFIKAILLEMEKEKFLKRVGNYARKIEWQLSESVYSTYKNLLKGNGAGKL